MKSCSIRDHLQFYNKSRKWPFIGAEQGIVFGNSFNHKKVVNFKEFSGDSFPIIWPKFKEFKIKKKLHLRQLVHDIRWLFATARCCFFDRTKLERICTVASKKCRRDRDLDPQTTNYLHSMAFLVTRQLGRRKTLSFCRIELRALTSKNNEVMSTCRQCLFIRSSNRDDRPNFKQLTSFVC